MAIIERVNISVAIATFAVLAVTPASAQGTDAQRDACTPDAFRLCSSAMPDASRVETCLRAAGPRLSERCYAVFYPPQQSDRSRDQRFDRRDDDRSDDRDRNDRYQNDRNREDRYGRYPSRGDRMPPPNDNDD